MFLSIENNNCIYKYKTLILTIWGKKKKKWKKKNEKKKRGAWIEYIIVSSIIYYYTNSIETIVNKIRLI